MTTYRELDLSLTAEQRKLKQDVHEFSKSVLKPAALALDRLPDPQQVIDHQSSLWTVFQTAYAQGFHTALIPKAYGGMDLTGLDAHLAFEELGWGSAEFAAALAMAGTPFAMIAATGKSDLIQELVIPFVAERTPDKSDAGPSPNRITGLISSWKARSQFRDPDIFGQVTARADGSDYLINGQKAAWVSNGTIATHAVTYLSLDKSKGMAGGGVAFIPLNLPGVAKGKPLDKIGQRTLNQGRLTFTNVRIPKRYLLFDSTSYETILNLTLVLTNGFMGAVFTGVARAAYEQALAYTKTRRQGASRSVSISWFKNIFSTCLQRWRHRALSRAAMVYNASAQPPALEYSIASKVYCTQACLEVTDAALQLFGGRGLLRVPDRKTVSGCAGLVNRRWRE